MEERKISCRGNIQQIKKYLNFETLHLNIAKNVQGENTYFFRHWDAERRVSVILSIELYNEIIANSMLLLITNSHIKIGVNGAYESVFITRAEEIVDGASANQPQELIQSFENLLKRYIQLSEIPRNDNALQKEYENLRVFF